MDLLSLSFPSLELGEALSKTADFLKMDDKEILERNEVVKERRRHVKQSKEEARTSGKEDKKELPTITLDEVAWHDTADNCWLVIYDFVYDVTDFLDSHPGGADVLLEYAGRDATLAFIGTGHSNSARQNLESYLIGELPTEERIFRIAGGVKVYGF